jgi:acyl-CoA thioesterase
VSDGSDIDWLGLERTGEGRWEFVVTSGLARLDGKFYGGTGIASATAVMEAETGRRALWTTVQFVSSCAEGATVRAEVAVGAAGRRSSQVQVSAWVDDRLLYSALGSTGAPPAADALSVGFGQMPDVPAPEDCPPWRPRIPSGPFTGQGWLEISEGRAASESGSMWMRMRDRPLTRPAMGFLADVVPSGVVRAAGHTGAGTSLDNSIRFGPEPDGDWMLVDVDPYMISSGYVHGAARLWSSGGALLGVASQTASALIFD